MRRYTILVCTTVLGCLFWHGAGLAWSGLLDVLTDKDSKERKILEGVGAVLGAAQDMDYNSELTIGESLALEGFHRYGLPVRNPSLQKYVNMVGLSVARNSLRPGIPYYFVVVDNPLQNAFSCPGGIVFLCRGLFEAIHDEAQLAGILAHEVAHVGHKHALQSIRRAQFFQGVGRITSATMKGEKGKEFETMIGTLQTTLFDRGLDQGMEFEADATGMETAYRTGYDPRGLLEVLQALKGMEGDARKQGAWFSTHPPLGLRIERCQTTLRSFPDRSGLARVPERYASRVKETGK